MIEQGAPEALPRMSTPASAFVSEEKGLAIKSQGQAALGRQSAAETLALSDKLCAQGMMTQQEFFQVQTAVKDGDYALARQIADCCCNTQRSIDSVKYESEKQSAALSRQIAECCCQTNANITAGNQRILDQLAADKMETLRSERDAARFQLSQNTQNDRIVAAIAAIGAAAANGAANPTAPGAAAAAAFGGAAGATAGGLGGF